MEFCHVERKLSIAREWMKNGITEGGNEGFFKPDATPGGNLIFF